MSTRHDAAAATTGPVAVKHRPLSLARSPAWLRPAFPVAKRGLIGATRVVGVVTRRLPGTGRRPSPPRFAATSTRLYAAGHPRSGVTVTEVHGAIEFDRPAPRGFPAGHTAFATTEVGVPPAIVARVPRGRVVGHYAAVVTDDDHLLFDLSPYFGAFVPSQHPIFLRPRLPEVSTIARSVCVLRTRGEDNYYHFLTDVLPRLELVRRAGIEPTHFVVNDVAPFQRELLERVGVSPPQVVRGDHVRADELIVPSLPDNHLRTPPWVAPWLRQQLLPDDVGEPKRRLFVRREASRHTRRLNNEAALLAALTPYDVEVIDPGQLPVAEQIRLFAEAEVVVGTHGAGLTNIAFCPPGATVVELFAPDYVNPCYFNLATTVEGLAYRYVVGDGRPPRAKPMHGVASDVTVDPTLVGRLLEEVL